MATLKQMLTDLTFKLTKPPIELTPEQIKMKTIAEAAKAASEKAAREKGK
jgi:hypothetical protein